MDDEDDDEDSAEPAFELIANVSPRAVAREIQIEVTIDWTVRDEVLDPTLRPTKPAVIPALARLMWTAARKNGVCRLELAEGLHKAVAIPPHRPREKALATRHSGATMPSCTPTSDELELSRPRLQDSQRSE